MTATNHVTTGALIGSIIINPWLAIPVSFFAHFALDALPHYDGPEHTSKRFLYELSVDFGLAAGVLMSIFLLSPTNWPVIIACGVACASPDLMWFRYWMAELRGKKLKLGKVASYHSKIQRYAKHSLFNLGIEMVWFIATLSALLYTFAP
jgi:hypothetical protein